ncbi:MAG: hypothetical protein ACKVVP_22905 [Chloroflexota bacterium]
MVLNRRDTGRLVLLTLIMSLGAVFAGCSAGTPLTLDSTANKSTINPDASGDRLNITYRVNHPSRVSVSIISSTTGSSFDLRTDEPRRPHETYVYPFDGTAPLPTDEAHRRVLQDGDYELVVTATDHGGKRDQQSHPISVRNADTNPPSIENLTAFPPSISPNFDGVDDVVTVSYRLTKRARVQRLTLDQDGNRVYVGGSELLEPGEYAERWDGTAKEKPVADGAYRYQVRAADAAGNVVQSEVPLQVAASGRPEGRILRVDFTPQQLMVGEVLTVRALVRNTGPLPLRTSGPDSGYHYSSFDSFGSIANHQYIDRLGTWRLGVDWAGSPTSTGSKYPYRWGFPKDLEPGEETVIEGHLRIEHGPALDRQVGPLNNRIFVYAGLIHEGIAFHDDRVGGRWIEIGY